MKITLLTSTFSPRLRIGEIARTTHRRLRTMASVTSISADVLPGSAVMADRRHPELDRARAAVRDADALVIVTPRYEPAGSAPLRTFLADLPRHAIDGKPVLPIGLGAIRSQATGLRRVGRPEETRTLPGCFLYDTWFEARLGRWQLTSHAHEVLSGALETLRSGWLAWPRGSREWEQLDAV